MDYVYYYAWPACFVYNGRHLADMNTNTLCDCGIIRELLQVLQWEGLDGHAQLSIVMCLSMLTEDRGKP